MCIRTRLKCFANDKAGSILPMFGIMAVPVFLSAGLAIDYSQVSRMQSKMAAVADAAVLAAAVKAKQLPDLKDTVKVKTTLKDEMTAFMQANTEGMKDPGYTIKDIKYDPDTGGVELKVKYTLDTSFLKVAGIEEVHGEVETAVFIAKEEQQALSMYLVLDRSGSMGWRSMQRVRKRGRWVWEYGEVKMKTLKTAVKSLHLQFEEKDPDHKFVRTGAVAYNHAIRGYVNLDWGSKHVNKFTQKISAGGGTMAHSALARATHYLRGDREKLEHEKRNKSDPKKYIVFMTDGTDFAANKARNQCRRAKRENITIYSVAFQAPAAGQALLKYCATSSDHYFNAESSTELLAAFRQIGEEAAEQLAIAK